ncbi:condensation domain-containing protein [Cytobacillus sp. FSL R5-0596]|uniref:condensation domain-containing protein n=1 Tax=Cytobacillus sp. FSL R5-0596 TaxID=2954696 RepID=UPI004046EC55
MHHIIGDRWSIDIILRELMDLYNNKKIYSSRQDYQYYHFVEWQQKFLQTEVSKNSDTINKASKTC